MQENFNSNIENKGKPFNFYENLLHSSPQMGNDIEYKLREKLQDDIQERQVWYSRISNSLTELGILNNYNSSSNRSRITNSTYMECWRKLCDEYGAQIFLPMNMITYEIVGLNLLNSMPEFKDHIKDLETLGKITSEDLNKKFCKDWPEIIPELENSLASCFLTGGSIVKTFMHPTLGRPTIKLIHPEDIIVDPSSSSLETAETIAHIFELTKSELESYIHSGVYVDVNLTTTDTALNDTANLKQKRDQFNGVNKSSLSNMNENNYKFCEMIYEAYPEDMGDEYGLEKYGNRKLFYKSHFQIDTGVAVLRQRSWYPNKKEVKKKTNLTKFTYIQAMNFWGIGLVDLLTPLMANASDVESEYAKSLKLTNMPTTIMSTQLTTEENTIQISAGKNNQINTDTGQLDGFKQINFPAPSPQFAEYLQTLENKMRNLTSISQIKMESLPANIQGSVLLSLLSKEYVSMSAVMRRIITGLNNLYMIVQEFMMDEMAQESFMDPEYQRTNGQMYNSKIEMVSTADPNYSNSTLQVVLYQTIFEYAMQHPQSFNMRELFSRFLEVLKVTNIDGILFTEEQLQQQAQAAQAQAQQAAEAQAAQQKVAEAQLQLQQQQQASQEKIMMTELQLKEKDQEIKLTLDKLKLAMEEKIEDEKLRLQAEKDNTLIQSQTEIEKTKTMKMFLDYFIEKTDLERKYGISLPDFIPSTLKEFNNLQDEIIRNTHANLQALQEPIINQEKNISEDLT